MLALLGGVASLLVAKWTVGLINSFLPTDAAGVFTFRMDGTMMLFAAALSLGHGTALRPVPRDAQHAARPHRHDPRQYGIALGRRASAGRFRTTLVTVQMGLAMTLLVMASLFVKSLVNVSREDLGIRMENVVTFGISPALNGYSRPRSMALFQRLEEELGAIPGVTVA